MPSYSSSLTGLGYGTGISGNKVDSSVDDGIMLQKVGYAFLILLIFQPLLLREVNASDVIILEGILVFHDQDVRDLMNMKIFVNTDADVRLARRIRRDTVERGRDINSVLEQYAKFVKPAFDDFVLPSKKYADVTVPRGGDNHVAIDLIVQHIRTKLGQHDLCKIYPNVYVIQSIFR
ncbi:hypothetical protein S83_029098 [Arachis hypogaea]